MPNTFDKFQIPTVGLYKVFKRNKEETFSTKRLSFVIWYIISYVAGMR